MLWENGDDFNITLIIGSWESYKVDLARAQIIVV